MLLTPLCNTLTDIHDSLIIELERPGVSKKELIKVLSEEALRLGDVAAQITEINEELIRLEKALVGFRV